MSCGSRERRCIVTGEVLPEARLVRFVVGPENEIVPDLAAKLPGRGIWVERRPHALERAVAQESVRQGGEGECDGRGRSARRVEALLVQRMQDHLGLARRAGELMLGFDSQSRALQSAPQARRFWSRRAMARKTAGESCWARARARRLHLESIDVLTADELSMALGRENVVHAALNPGRLADRLALDAGRLGGSGRVNANRTGPNSRSGRKVRMSETKMQRAQPARRARRCR